VRNVQGECLVRAGRKDEGVREIRQSRAVVAAKWPVGTYYRAEADARVRSI
jgi:hypothetical protein